MHYSDPKKAVGRHARGAATGYAILMGRVIEWKSRKKSVALSTTDVEYYAASMRLSQIVYLLSEWTSSRSR
jgi:hypothetical protein